MALDLFKVLLPSILQHNEDILEDPKEYNGYIVNRAISVHLDCVLHANLMNMNSILSNKMQYDYLRHAIRKAKRPFKPWHKHSEDDKINTIKKFFNYSDREAEQIADLVNKEQLEEMNKRMDIGGASKR